MGEGEEWERGKGEGVYSLSRYHLTKVALERKESLMGELEEEREKLIAKVGTVTHQQVHYIPLV